MHKIRPHKLFTLVQSTSYLDRMVQVVLPDKETPVFFDTAILLALGKLIRPRTIFEFGTYIGAQTLNLAVNFPEARVYTFDLDQTAVGGAGRGEVPDLRTRFGVQEREVLIHLNAQDSLAFLNTPYEKRIVRLYGDSNKYDFSGLANQMDVVYIDGGHDPVTLDSDTKNAFQIVSQGHPACIAWHDCGNPVYPHIVEYLEQLSETRDLFYIEESWTAFFLQTGEDLVAKLKH